MTLAAGEETVGRSPPVGGRWRPVLAALGTGITVFLVVTVLGIELLDFEFSAIVALPAGLAVGSIAALVVGTVYGRTPPLVRATGDAVATFGIGILALAGARYVDVPVVRYVAITDLVLLAAAVALLAGLGSVVLARRNG